MSDKLPPHSEQVEKAILGCLLSASDCITEAAEIQPRSFYIPANQEIFRAIRAMSELGKGIDPVTVSEKLKEWNRLDEVGGFAALAQLAGEGIPAMFQSYLAELVGLHSRRTLLQISERMATIASDGTIAAEHIPDSIESAIESIRGLGGKRNLPAMQDWADEFPEDQTEIKEIVDGIMHQGSKMVLGGGSKVGKTWCFIDLAVSVASGSPWWGIKTTQSKVLYLNFEIQPMFFRRRVKQVCASKQISRVPGWLTIQNLRGHCADFTALLPEVAKQIRNGNFGLIILDPIYKGMGGRDENSAGDIADLCNQIERLTVNTGAAVVFGAHFSKGNQSGKEAIDRISGSGVFARDPDSILVMTKHQEENVFTIDATLRNFKPVEPFCVRWEFPLMKRDVTLDPAKLKQAGGRKREHSAQTVLDALGNQSLTSTEWQKLADTEYGIPRRTFDELKKDPLVSKQVHQSAIDNKWQRLKTK